MCRQELFTVCYTISDEELGSGRRRYRLFLEQENPEFIGAIRRNVQRRDPHYHDDMFETVGRHMAEGPIIRIRHTWQVDGERGLDRYTLLELYTVLDNWGLRPTGHEWLQMRALRDRGLAWITRHRTPTPVPQHEFEEVQRRRNWRVIREGFSRLTVPRITTTDKQ